METDEISLFTGLSGILNRAELQVPVQ
jgi:hypothetical protein